MSTVRMYISRAAALLLGALTLGACTAMPRALSLPASPEAAPPQVAPVAVDYATSTEIHPEIWPKGTSGVPDDPAIDAEAARLVAQMTVEEKVGQILQPDISDATPDDVRRYHVGSILNAGDDGPYGDLRASAAEWLKAADEYYQASVDVAPGRPKIPLIWGIDAMHGQDHVVGATIFPHNIGLGAMRDPALVRKIGEVTAEEMRVTGQDWTFAPTIAVVRDDRWGRTYESYSEDPALVTKNAEAMIEGLQGMPGSSDFLNNGHVLATAKHYIGDGGTDQGHDQGDTLYGEPALRDLFAPPYEAAIKAGVQSVMASYSSWRGQKMHGDKALLEDVLVGRLGFNGFVVSDYRGFAQLKNCTVTDCPDTLLAGVDMYMTAGGWKKLYATLLDQARSGRIPMSRLDEAVTRILRVKLRMDLLTAGRPSSRPFGGQFDLLGSAEHRAVARQAVRESLVLLKNDGGLLPLSPRAHVLVAGDGADNISKQAGGWTISWQGNGNARADFPHATTIYEGIKTDVEAAGGTATLSADGTFSEKPDVAIVVIGENPYAEGHGDRPSLDFEPGDKHDLRLLESLRAQGIPVVTVFLSGRPLYVTPEINASNAFVAAWLPGSEGEGVADVLFAKPDGSVADDFRGRLSFSWPRGPQQTALNAGVEPSYPLFPLGYGLTYATPRNLGNLAVASVAEAPVAPQDTIVNEGRGVVPWSMALVDLTGQIIPVDSETAVVPTAALRVARSDWRKQEDTLVATWNGLGAARLAAKGPAPVSFARQTTGKMDLALDVKVETKPNAPVLLGMGTSSAIGQVDLTSYLNAAEGWTRIAVPLSCFRNAGADMGAVSLPLVLTTAGRMKLDIYAARIEVATNARGCPKPLPVNAAPVSKPRAKSTTRHHQHRRR